MKTRTFFIIFRFINGIYPLQFGQWWLQSSNHTSFDIYPPNLKIKPFVGCIRNIIDNGNMYDLNKPLAQSNSGLGCPDLEIDCPPCYHGYCDTSKTNSNVFVISVGVVTSAVHVSASFFLHIP